MVLMRVFSTAQGGTNRITNHISSKLAMLSNEITTVYQSARNHVRSFARRRNSGNDRSMDTPFSYLSTFQQSTDKKAKKSGQMEVTNPVLARRAMGFGPSPLLSHNNTPIPTLPDEKEELFQTRTDEEEKPREICWRVVKQDNNTLAAIETVQTQNSHTDEQAKRAGRVDMDTILRASELSAADDVHSNNKESELLEPKMEIDETPVEICWRVARAELPKDVTTPMKDGQTDEPAKRAGLANVDALLRAFESLNTEHTPSADNDSVIINLRMDIELSEKNLTKHQKKTLRRREEKYEEVKDDFRSEMKRCEKILDSIPENKDIERFCRTKKRANAADRNWICKKFASKSPKTKDSSSKVSSPPPNKTVLPPFNQDLSIASTTCQGKEDKTPVAENAQVGVIPPLSVTIGCEVTAPSNHGVQAGPASDVQLAAVTKQDPGHQSPKQADTESSSTTPEEQQVANNTSKVSSGLVQQSAPKKPVDAGQSCEMYTHSSQNESVQKSSMDTLADIAAPSLADCNNNSKA